MRETARMLATNLFPDRWRIAEFVSRASTEITPHDEPVVLDLAKVLPRGTTVYVAHTPEASLDDVVRVSQRVQSAGLRASPHIVARRLPSESALRVALARLRSVGVEQVMVIAGDTDEALGPYQHSLELMDSGVLSDIGLHRVAVGGHPEGLKGVDPEQRRLALRHKQEFARRSGISMHITTQFGFDPQSICEWVRSLAFRAVKLPVHVGIAGPTSLTRLSRFATLCRVGGSLRMATRNVKAVANVARMVMTPEETIPALMRCRAGFELAQIAQPHFYSFGGALACARWIRAVGSGEFEITSQGKIKLPG